MASTIMAAPDVAMPQSNAVAGKAFGTNNLDALVSTMNTNDDSKSESVTNSNATKSTLLPQTKIISAVQVKHGFSIPVATSTTIPTSCTSSSKSLHDKRHKKSSPTSSIFQMALKEKSNHPSNALDALATLASTAHNRLAASSDSHAMPPPPNRRVRRMRSASNPEGMEKWDLYSHNDCDNNRTHFVLPSSILEEELASATDACEAHEKRKLGVHSQQMPVRKTGMTDFSIQSQPNVDGKGLYGTSPTSIISMVIDDSDSTMISTNKTKKTAHSVRSGKKHTPRKKSQRKGQKPSKSNSESNKNSSSDSKQSSSSTSDPDSTENEMEEEEEVDEADLEPEELLKRARSRLFEDLSAENGLEKGGLAMPHSLEKYKEVYNKNGRIGIYTPAERAAIISKFNSKRTRRTWKKKIRYNCRKSLADRRMRVKGRFVKRAVEQNNKVENVMLPEINPLKDDPSSSDSNPPLESEISSSGSDSSRTSSPIPIAPPAGPLAPVQEDMDVEMPDVSDPDAGFNPTTSQPFRRTRRHTIT